MKTLLLRKLLFLTLIGSFAFGVSAQTNSTVKITAEDYARAEKMLGFNTAPLVDRAGVRPTFLPDGRFWYRVLTPTGSEYVLVNPADGSRTANTDLTKLGVSVPPAAAAANRTRNPNAITSPDGKRAAYIKD